MPVGGSVAHGSSLRTKTGTRVCIRAPCLTSWDFTLWIGGHRPGRQGAPNATRRHLDAAEDLPHAQHRPSAPGLADLAAPPAPPRPPPPRPPRLRRRTPARRRRPMSTSASPPRRRPGPRSAPKRGEGSVGPRLHRAEQEPQQLKKDDDPLHVRDRILHVYSRRGSSRSSTRPTCVDASARWASTPSAPRGSTAAKTAMLEEEGELDEQYVNEGTRQRPHCFVKIITVCAAATAR